MTAVAVSVKSTLDCELQRVCACVNMVHVVVALVYELPNREETESFPRAWQVFCDWTTTGLLAAGDWPMSWWIRLALRQPLVLNCWV